MLDLLTSNWYIFFPLACSLFVALRLAEGSADLGGHFFGINLLRHAVATLLIFALLAVGLRGNILGLGWLILLGFFAAILYWKYRRLERSALLLTALQAENEMQQFAVCESFWIENRGWLRRVSARLRNDLGQGKSWWDALQQRRAARGIYEKMSVRLADRYGTGSQINRTRPFVAISGELNQPLQIEGEAERLLGRLMVFSWVLLGLPLVGLVLVFVMPTFQQIFAEFGLPLPGVMRTVVELSYRVTAWGWGPVLAVLPLALVGLGLLAGFLWLFPQCMERPPLRWLCGEYYRAAGFTALARTLDYEIDLIAACEATSQLIAMKSVSVPYAHAAELLQSGQTPSTAFRQAGLINRREFNALGSGLDHSQPGWPLQQLARWKLERMLQRYWILVQFAVVLITLLLAAIVGTLAVGMFQMLSELVYALD